MQAFVTGATGLLGNNLVRMLLESGHEVRALVRSKEKAQRELGDTRAHIVLGDMAHVEGFADALEGVDVLFHTAAYFRESFAPGDHASAIRRINVDATLELTRAAHLRGVAKMIDTGSAANIGVEAGGLPGDEWTPPWAGMRKNLYLHSKLDVEACLREFSLEKRFFIATAMPSWIWGPHDAAPTASGQFVMDALCGTLPPVIPPGGSSVVDARDAAAAMLRIAESGRTGQRYILSGRFVELAEIIEQLRALTSRRAPTLRIPFAGALALAAGAEAWSYLTRRPSVLSRQGVRIMNARIDVTAAKAQEELGATFRPFERTLADTLSWMRERFNERRRTDAADRRPAVLIEGESR